VLPPTQLLALKKSLPLPPTQLLALKKSLPLPAASTLHPPRQPEASSAVIEKDEMKRSSAFVRQMPMHPKERLEQAPVQSLPPQVHYPRVASPRKACP
jgi:hypothetical protein